MSDSNKAKISRYETTLLYAATLMNNILLNVVTGDTHLVRADAIRGAEEIFEVLAEEKDQQPSTPAKSKAKAA
ncbi:hypothetical protein [Endozoicomonas sp. YOMI1]|uniref:hypothetical protein n=1 Tax=Endozoicomonas sp. YOMI1 TaxID=2828739 RepID=UPI00214899D8|nr:hypothetical protein [Endozoicomonas sp. YOMI1]